MSQELQDINKRIVEILEMENLKPTQLADMIGVQRSSVSHILNGRNKPSLDFIIKLLQKFDNINPDWLLFGIKPIYKVSPHSNLFDTQQPSTGSVEPTTPDSQSTITEEPDTNIDTNVDNAESNKINQNENTQTETSQTTGTIPPSTTPEQILVLFPDKTFVAYKERK